MAEEMAPAEDPTLYQGAETGDPAVADLDDVGNFGNSGDDGSGDE